MTASILDCIGNTSLVALRSARILLKLESENPTGSMKDRMALAMIEAAEADGRLKPGGTVVDANARRIDDRDSHVRHRHEIFENGCGNMSRRLRDDSSLIADFDQALATLVGALPLSSRA